MVGYTVRALDAGTWDDFARLVERHNGVWGGCWCLGFHAEGAAPGPHRRAAKEHRVREGRAHAALVYDGDDCVGWCQYGSPDELPRIKRVKAYEAASPAVARWRITCFFSAADHRGTGVADAALTGALDQIRALGGGLVESFPEDATGRRTSAGFLHNATLSLFERHGFVRGAQLGKHHWLVTRRVRARR